MTEPEHPTAREAPWAGEQTLYDVVPHLDALVETIGRDLVLGEFALARDTAHAAAQMLVEQGEPSGIRDEATALLVVRALAEAAAATERAIDAAGS
ncbi:hypothetical protein [Streptomyces longispororuber]|uniref:hypothetical protein n=1 Tax=Streptomyces longispororuber TaxID=68230 RepID=UPI00210AFF96|nr:hypothetical protein [Streptomyces longispororuber]MCQ4208937.1 hypothetical protein [Streptomyces longispororuber]